MKIAFDTYVASAVMGLSFAVFMFGAIAGSLWAMLLGIGSIFLISWAIENLT